MADLIDIEFGDQRLRVPAWATEATLEAVMKYNEITARALNKLVGVSTDGNKTFRIQEHYFKDIVDELKKSKKKQEELVKQNNTIIKAEKTKTSSARAKTQNSNNLNNNFDKKMSELTKNYSTSISLVEGSLLYLSKNLVDLNLVIKQVSDSYKNILPNIKGGSGSSGSGSYGGSSSDDDVFNREKRDLSFKSLFKSFAEDLIERTEENKSLAFDSQAYMKNIDNLKKAVLTGNTKGLLNKYVGTLQVALDNVAERKTPDEKTIKELKSALKDFSSFNEEYISVSKRLYNYYIKDTSLSAYDQENKKSNDVAKALIRSQENITNVGKETIVSLRTLAGNALTTGLTFSKVSDIVTKVAGSIPLIGGVIAGVTAVGATVLEEYMNGLRELSGVSVGLGGSLTELNGMALQAGMTLSDYSKMVSENASAIKSLGKSTNDGVKQFNKLSITLRSAARQEYNMFGLSDPEYNKILMEEVELRRKSGMDSVEIYNSVSDSMNDLLYNTAQLAGITGQNAREMRKNMIQTRQADATLNLAMANLSKSGPEAAKNADAVLSAFSEAGDIGKQFGTQLLKAADSDLDMRVGMSEELKGALALSGGIGDEISKFIDENIKTMNSSEFRAKLLEMTAKLSDNLISQQNKDYSMATLPFGKAAIELGSGLAGLNKVVGDNITEANKIGADLKSDEAAWMQLPNALEAVSQAVKNSTIAETLSLLGINIDKGGKLASDALYSLAERITKQGIVDTAADMAIDSTTGFISDHPIASLAGGSAALLAIIVSLKKAIEIPLSMLSLGINAVRGRVGGNLVDDAARAATSGAGGSNAARSGGRSLFGRVAVPLTIGLGAYDAYTVLNDDTLNTRQKSEGVGEAIGGTGGALAGMAYGGAAGAALGSVVPIIGTAIGGVLGGIAGGILGGFGGSAVGGAAGDLVGAAITEPPSVSSSDLISQATMTNVWLQNLNGISETIRDDISSIKNNGGFKKDESVTDIINDSAQKTQAMIRLMSETNRLLGIMIRKYDETANN